MAKQVPIVQQAAPARPAPAPVYRQVVADPRPKVAAPRVPELTVERGARR